MMNRTIGAWGSWILLLSFPAASLTQHVSQLDAALADAINAGDVAAVKQAIQNGADPSARRPPDPSALGLAGITPLYCAATAGQPEIISLLLSHHADPNIAAHGTRMTPLMVAERAGNLASVKLLVRAGTKLNVGDDFGTRAIGYANGPIGAEVVRLLISNGATVDARDQAGRPPLMMASRRSDAEVVTALLNAGANARARSRFGENALHYVAAGRMGEGASMNDANATAVVSDLLKHGADVNSRNGAGRTPLSIAAEAWDEVVLNLLLAAGTDVNIADRGGRTALTWALEDGEENGCVRALLRANARVGLFDAIVLGRNDEAISLIRSRSGLGIRGAHGETALMAAAMSGRTAIVRSLLLQRVGVRGKDDRGFTALDVAIAGRPFVASQVGTVTFVDSSSPADRLSVVELILARRPPIDSQARDLAAKSPIKQIQSVVAASH